MQININNPIILHPAISFDNMERKMERKINNLQKINLQKFADRIDKKKSAILCNNGNIKFI